MDYLPSLVLVMMIIFGKFVAPGWRAWIFLLIPVGFLQEPLRKLATNQPPEFQLIVVGVFAAALMAAIGKFGKPTLKPLWGTSQRTRKLLLFFIALVIAQSFQSIIRFGTPLVAMLGLLSYLLPIPTLWVAHQFAASSRLVENLIKLYVASGFVISSSIFVNYLGVDIPLFRQVGGEQMIVYDQTVGIVELYCGFLRSPEVAAWHAAATGCLAVVLAMSARKLLYLVIGPVIYVSSFYFVVLTGRRKALAIMALFLALYMLGVFLVRHRSSRSSAIAALLVGALVLAGAVFIAPTENTSNPLWQRSATTYDDSWERFRVLGLDSIGWAYYVGGVFGIGTGAGAQGAQHIGGVQMQGSAEGGLGRITLELGLFGLFLAIACSVAVARQVKLCIAIASRHDANLLKLVLGIMAFVGANVPVFIGAAQIFGDPFVLLLLGLLLGFVLAVPRIVHERQRLAARTQARQITSQQIAGRVI